MAVEVLRRREPLTDVPLEVARLRIALDDLTFTPQVLANGFGMVDTARVQRGIDMLRGALGIDRAMPWSDIYDLRYLPSATDQRQV